MKQGAGDEEEKSERKKTAFHEKCYEVQVQTIGKKYQFNTAVLSFFIMPRVGATF